VNAGHPPFQVLLSLLYAKVEGEWEGQLKWDGSVWRRRRGGWLLTRQPNVGGSQESTIEA
jgi:hypothetical protein